MAASVTNNQFSSVVKSSIKTKPKVSNASRVDKIDKQTKLQKKSTKQTKSIVNKPQTRTSKRKAGRPKQEKAKAFTINIKQSLLDGLQTGALLKYKGNITAHINALIEQDIKNNQVLYSSIQDLQDQSK